MGHVAHVAPALRRGQVSERRPEHVGAEVEVRTAPPPPRPKPGVVGHKVAQDVATHVNNVADGGVHMGGAGVAVVAALVAVVHLDVVEEDAAPGGGLVTPDAADADVRPVPTRVAAPPVAPRPSGLVVLAEVDIPQRPASPSVASPVVAPVGPRRPVDAPVVAVGPVGDGVGEAVPVGPEVVAAPRRPLGRAPVPAVTPVPALETRPRRPVLAAQGLVGPRPVDGDMVADVLAVGGRVAPHDAAVVDIRDVVMVLLADAGPPPGGLAVAVAPPHAAAAAGAPVGPPPVTVTDEAVRPAVGLTPTVVAVRPLATSVVRATGLTGTGLALAVPMPVSRAASVVPTTSPLAWTARPTKSVNFFLFCDFVTKTT